MLKYLIRLELIGYKNAIKAFIKGCGTKRDTCASETVKKQIEIKEKLRIVRKDTDDTFYIDVKYLEEYVKLLTDLFTKLKETINSSFDTTFFPYTLFSL